ncbi:Acetyl-CoA synthetase I (ACSI, ADP-forming), subunit beta [mine drainage metagenome]|uniref:Acetyl-CoA synthetase I (ACSI, ADP-forming), subunit beta n=1 Tax=mine drainage metagenome TaxID=410659 RepID=T1APX9_9ZZZZ
MAELVEYMGAYKLMKKYGIRTVQSAYVSNAEQAIKFAGGKPIVLKAISGKALHKTKSGLVALNLTGERSISSAYASLVRAAEKYKPYKILAQRMVGSGVEVIIGGREDAQFGKLILFGLGGIYVEVFKDISIRVCPIRKSDAKSMLDDLKSKGMIAKDEKSAAIIEGLLLKTSRMLLENDIKELDLNPIILHDGTYDAVDLRVLK